MVAERRFAPLAIALLVLFGVLLLRLFQVQVLQHETWAAEAASLAKNSQLLPSHRGRLLDRHGRVLVEDEDTWRIELVYRDFRRGHPLGLVAHARSSLEMRAVSLAEALANLEPWAREIVSLSPAAVDSFAKGGPLPAASLSIPPLAAVSDAPREARASRASDLRFYAGALLRVDEGERRRIRAAEKQEPKSDLSYAEIVAAARGSSAAAVLADLATELRQEPERLARLARLLAAGDRPGGPASQGGAKGAGASDDGTVGSLLARLEAARARAEDAAADELFAEATGFSPGRVSTASLARVFDLDWIARALRWDRARLVSWAQGRRAAFEGDLADICVPRILARAGLEEDAAVAERILDGLASLYVRGEISPESWRELDEVCVVAEIPSLFDLPRRPRWAGEDAPAIPIADPDVRALDREVGDPWLTLGTIAELSEASLGGSEPAKNARATNARATNAREWSERWKAIAADDWRLEGDAAREALKAVLSALEARLAAASDAGFEACLAAAATEATGDALPAALPLDRSGLERAQQKERFLLRDLASRPVVLASEAEYELVHLLERDAALYRGFAVAPATRRAIRVRGPDGLPLARALLGAVRGPTLRDVVASEALANAESEGSSAADAEIAQAAMRRTDRRGSFGLEAYFDAELRGRNGWFETSGLEDERAEGVLKAAVDGEDVVLTLDLDLQLAAQETLAHPTSTSDPTTDAVWLQNPVGAIAVITLDGEVLAAASEPTQDGLPPASGRDGERSHARERTLTRPTFNPPGSVFKPFVAAYALDHGLLDPTERFSCVPLDDGGHGYENRNGKMHCKTGGHGSSDLAHALEGSCNAAFAQIGERFSAEQLLEMAEVFGFGLPTGIRASAPAPRGSTGRGSTAPVSSRRSGVIEHGELAYAKTLPKKLKEPVSRMRFANGLSLVEATPMQVARATAGLVTGRLPELRIARTLGGKAVPKVSSELPVSESARRQVCAALEDVVSEPGGTAYGKGLDRTSLGFTFACKTGSADTWDLAPGTGGSEPARGQKKMRKQTWVAGWFPVETPKAVVVVMLHDTVETSSHTAVYLAAQFLRSPAVKRFVDGSEPGAQEAAPRAAAAEVSTGGEAR